MPILTQADLEARFGAQVIRAILDDNNDGTADASAVARIIDDATSKVMSYALAAGYDLTALMANPPNEIKRLTLDAAEVLIVRRFPASERDWRELKEANEAELKNLRLGVTQLDVVNGTGIEPPGPQQSPVLVSGGGAQGELPSRIFDDMGDY